MNDLRKMDIEDIDKHIEYFRLFTKFLKENGEYQYIMRRMFHEHNRTPIMLFKDINNDSLSPSRSGLSSILNRNYYKLARRWSSVLIFVPYYGGWWEGEDVDRLRLLHQQWVAYLKFHEDNKKNNTI